jgi:tRNA (guanine10-N2)-dimethyltransferase
VTRLFLLLSGEHQTLPFFEVTSILEAEGFKHSVIERLRQVFRIEADKDAVKSIISRAAMTRVCCQELFTSQATMQKITDTLRRTSIDTFIKKDESFVVRVRRIGEASTITGMELERKLGKTILEKVEGAKVRLKTPEHTFFGVLTENKFVFGLKLGEILPKPFSERRPRKRPFFQPSAMPAKLARCMVNLTRTKAGDVIFDPFCGTGTFLIEAGLIGCKVFGSDAQRHMVEGSLRNLRFFGVEPEAMIVADAAHPPITRTNCIVTDPPYGRTASTLGESTEQIVRKVLPEFQNLLRKKGKICIAAPKTMNIGKMAKEVGLKHLESHYVYVHRTLTREVAVLEKN